MSWIGSSTSPTPGTAASLTTPAAEAGPSGSSQSPENPGSSSTIPAATAAAATAAPGGPSVDNASSSSPPLSSPSFPTSSTRSHAPSQLSPRTPTTASTSVTTHPVIHPNLPSPSTPQQTAQARAALVGTIANLLDTELQGRAGLLHSNAAALEKQERDVAKATEALRKENDKLVKVVKEGSKKVLETGNVQNWAEVLERDFMVLEDTMRRVRKRDADGGCSDPDCSGCSSGTGSWSGSRTPSRRGSFDEEDQGPEARGEEEEEEEGKGKAVEDLIVPDGAASGGDPADERMDIDEGVDVTQDDQEGAFASVNNAIAASISEAMATSIDDFMVPSTAAAEPERAPASELSAKIEDVLDKGKGVERPGEATANTLSEMEVDGDQDRVRVEVPASLDDRDIKALKEIGLAPETGHEREEAGLPSDDVKANVSSDDTQPSELTKNHELAVDQDKMDIDTPDEPAGSAAETSHLDAEAGRHGAEEKGVVAPQPAVD